MTAVTAPQGISAENAALFEAFATHLALRPAHTRDAYLRDVAQLLALAGAEPVLKLTRANLLRYIATLHGRGLSGRSLARALVRVARVLPLHARPRPLA